MSLMRDCYFQDNHVTSRDISVKKSANKKAVDLSGLRVSPKGIYYLVIHQNLIFHQPVPLSYIE